ncbi:MAG: NADH-quinone oxidoreductase subunit J [Ornithinimicrobium sp.]|jgi:NADH-quinone oxidoreductase subunit J|uniref:NADH-quinone oxidoreductase subunit J n=1 Tax=Ornithinimicrobium sp. TaxID=1977084 RepID=UPI003D9B36A4
MTGAETVLFWVLAPVTVLGALGLLFASKAVHAAMATALVMITLGVFYIAQQAEFVGVIQIFVYSGAVMMLFLFVVMLVGVDASDSHVETLPGQRLFAYLFGLVFAAVIVVSLVGVDYPETIGLAAIQEEGSVTALAREIFERQVFGFEVLGILLVIAVMGAMVLAHHERLTPPVTQRSRSAAKIRSGQWLAGKPNPGVYARHNAADTPALLPDGTPTQESVPRVLIARDQVASYQDYAATTDAAFGAVEAESDPHGEPVSETSPGAQHAPDQLGEGDRR